MSFWKFNEESIRQTARDLPVSILREQADILAEKTRGMMYGRTVNLSFHPRECEIVYNMATHFEIVVPAMDNYSHTLFIMYTRPENDYPIAITVGSNMIDDAEVFKPQYECTNRIEFINALKEILSSDRVSRSIEILYSKVAF